MSDIYESDIEAFDLECLQAQGYASCNTGKNVTPDNRPLRASKSDVVLKTILEESVARLNPSVPDAIREEAIQQV